jgi:hypothetical protein
MLNFWTREQCEQYQMMHFGISCATCERWDDECLGSVWTVKQARVRRKKCLRRQRDPCIHHCCTPKGPRARTSWGESRTLIAQIHRTAIQDLRTETGSGAQYRS